MTNRKRRPEPGKWGWWKFFAEDRSFLSLLPATAVLNGSSLERFINKYDAVFIKPNGAHRGEGIVKVWKTRDGFAFVRERGEPKVAASLDVLSEAVREARPQKKYVIQRAVDLAEVDGLPYDFRVMMMRSPLGRWQYVGMLARVAHKDCVITNARRGHGMVIPAEDALERSFKKENVESMKRQLIETSHKICNRLDRYKYKRYWKVGVDLAFDKNGRLWMLEANTWPGISAFRKLEDKATYKKIKAMEAAYRRRRRNKG
ncbi:YheC/YheD family protein [Effusibacillus lacus]|uniref:ATP-grasp domain-containing protein n=1 Tax=Effusibacillus lacus TaxID=1348429 RepID=A0A292YLM1_9BACL|nr:YheC/YheD family protein [Effusibacillus lacus]TCS75380.1 YheC/D-like protein [Effusibacillus lacus]GAX89811.1 hypothetical protein EFBL_1436 [Effusibacillus lacus]